MFIKVNGARLFIDIVGAGLAGTPAGPAPKPPLLVLHGGPGYDHFPLRAFFDRFADVAQVIYLDHRGNGRSMGEAGADPTTWSLDQWADDAKALCDALGLDRPIVIGQSFGGFVAQAYAARHPGHARGLVFSSTAAAVRLEDILDDFESLGGPAARDAAARFWTRTERGDIEDYQRLCTPLYHRSAQGRDEGLRPAMRPEVFRHFCGPAGEMWRMDARPGLAAVSCPTLVLTGDRDPVTPPERSREIFAALRPEIAHYVEIPETGHGAFRDKPAETERELRRFIGNLS